MTQEKVAPSVVALEHVYKTFPASGNVLTQALHDVSFQVRQGEFVSLIGPSGCGKSTILNLTAGLYSPDKGTVAYEGSPVTQPNTSVGYMTQDDALFGWRHVIDNIALPLEIRRLAKAERRQQATDILSRVGLSGFERHYPNQLSGGMRKRVSLARTLVYQPDFLLLDEPFGALDAQTRLVMQRELKKIVKELKLSVMLVTHDLHEAITLSDRILVFSKRPARLIEEVHVPPATSLDDVAYEKEKTALYHHLWSLLTSEQELVSA